MKRLIIVLMITLLLVSVAFILGATPTIEGQIQPQYELMRAESDEDSSTVDLTSAGDYANMPSGAFELMDDGFAGTNRKITIITCAGAAANKTYTVTYYGYMRFNGPAQRIMAVNYTTGTQAVVKYLTGTQATATNKFWSDTASVTNYRSSIVGQNDCGGNNGVAELTIYTGGFKYIWPEVSGADGATGNEAGDVSIYCLSRN